MQPDHAAIHVRNEIRIDAEPGMVWKWLCRAGLWPTWYANCAWLRFENTPGPDLALNTTFRWQTFGARVRSTVRVFEPTRALEWDARAIGLRAYHGWLLEETAGGVWVITEESQNGPLPTLLRWYLKPTLLRGHQQWVESLRRVSTTG